MKKFNQLSKAEMKNVSGGGEPFPPCTLEFRWCNIVWDSNGGGTNHIGYCKSMGAAGCWCYNDEEGRGIQSGDCYE